MLALLKRYRELILVAVLLLVPLGVFFAHAKQPPERSALDRAIVWLATPIEKAIGWTARTALSGWDGYVALRGSHREAAELRKRVQELEIERQQLLGDRAEAERLRRLLSFVEETTERRYLGARVVGVRLGTAGLQVLTIDRGSDDGVAKHMPIMTSDGVVGRVLAVAGHSADVLVLSDRNSSIAVRVERTRARANVRGLGKPDAAKLEYALRAEDIIEGDALVTSGTDGVFPRGIKVGKVTQLERTAHGLFQEARVVPAVDVTRVEEVLVVTSWERPGEVLPAAYAPGRRK
ncbi:MAG TPA: rod shape-determining protein MreC [Anaeromyxobacter sp.]